MAFHPEEIAAEIITGQEFDVFDSEKAARSHAEAEGIDPASFTTVGMDYTAMPRRYSPDLELDIIQVLKELGSQEEVPFVHTDLYGVTVGNTLPSDADTGPLAFVIPEHGRSCDLRIPRAEVWFDPMVPYADAARAPWHTDAAKQEAMVEVRLGRNILGPESTDQDIKQAGRDTFRPWETVLAVGKETIAQYADELTLYLGKQGVDYDAIVSGTEDLQAAEGDSNSRSSVIVPRVVVLLHRLNGLDDEGRLNLDS